MKRRVFLVSDHTCITVETIAKSLLSQFPTFEFERTILPFTATREKTAQACRKIAEASQRDGQAPLVFSTLADEGLRAALQGSEGVVFDLFDTFIDRLERTLGQCSSHAVGRAHGLTDTVQGQHRIEALRFSLDTDDGLGVDAYAEADLILVGVSRSGKTPACLYLAMYYGICAANYPLAEEELAHHALPPILLTHRRRLFGLTMNPERLHQLREERRSASRYASFTQCAAEIRAAEALFLSAAVPTLDTSAMSVEEIAANVLHRSGLKRQRW